MPRVKLIHVGHGEYVEPLASFYTCEHPKEWRRFDSRFSAPSWQYCTLCGRGMIHPFHGYSAEEIATARRRADEIADNLVR